MEVIGIVHRIVYSGKGWSVAKLIEDHTGEERTIVGYMSVVPGEHIILKGTLKNTEKYGIQIQVNSYRREVPTTEQGVTKLLGSGLIKGIGPKRATWMVNHFGTSVLDLIKDRDTSLREVPGLGPKLIESIYQQYHQFYGRERLVMLLTSSGFTRGMTRKIMNHFNDHTLGKVEHNPYLLMKLSGVGFRRADYFAKLLNISETAPQRIQEGVVYLLEEQSRGNTYLPKKVLFKEFNSNIKFEEDIDKTALFDQALLDLTIDNRVLTDDKGIHLAKFYYAEAAVAKELVNRSTMPLSLTVTSQHIMKFIVEWEASSSFTLTTEQKTSVIRSIMDNLTIITGSPGTGKTSTVAAILYACEHLGYSVSLAAPTGRAAKRLQETTGRRASTIHRLLEFGTNGDFTFKYNKDNKYSIDVLILDEVSMIDIMLMHSVLNALKPTTKLIMVGDKDQLQSVSAGNVLDDMIKSGKINTIELRQLFRQDSNALLVENAQTINSGRILSKTAPLRGGTVWGDSDFYITENVTKDTVIQLLQNHIPNKYHIKTNDILVLTPMRKRYGSLNCATLNEEIQELVNKSGEKIPIENCSFRVGDKVMQTRNDYNKDVFNGDIGYIVSWQQKTKDYAGYFNVNFYGTVIQYDFVEHKTLVHAWTSTIHKAQGAEADAVIVVLPDNHFNRLMLTRNLLYTAITRARKVCILIAKNREIIKAIETSGTETRYTDLTDKIDMWYIRLQKSRSFNE